MSSTSGGNDVKITRRLLAKAALGLAGATMLMQFPAFAADKPAPFDKPGVKIALVRYLSTGDFFPGLSLRRRGAVEGPRRRSARARQPPGRSTSGRHGRPGHRARRAGHHHPARADGIDEGGRPARRRRRHQGRRLRRQCREP
ncbi:exported hypothetical protein [Mesorhizobium metallidurans STM 2683]|uniref:Uncharacterized protein n=1 Tax=Mesorhizobium metallidurans STM 2683 TaxID=1297569 RepID=M5EVB5_9HYPH|nr:exported hypothetical protein [Mesorhizobium metallidurans STM 2683]